MEVWNSSSMFWKDHEYFRKFGEMDTSQKMVRGEAAERNRRCLNKIINIITPRVQLY